MVFEELLFAAGRHRFSVALGRSQVPAGEEGNGVELIEVAVEEGPILRTLDLEARPFAHGGEDLFRVAQLAGLAVYDRVLVPGAPRKIKRLLPSGVRAQYRLPGKGGQPQQRRRGGLQHFATFHIRPGIRGFK